MYVWQKFFDNTHPRISRLHRALRCRYILVQGGVISERPDVPAVTPLGFETWDTLLLREHPDQEVDRLRKILWVKPVINPDDERKCFPKILNPKPFPLFSSHNAQESHGDIMLAHCGGNSLVSFYTGRHSRKNASSSPRATSLASFVNSRTSSWNGTRRGPSEFDPSEQVLEINDREGSASALRDRQCITITEVGDTSPT